MKEKAVVLTTNGDKAVVSVQRSTACASCGQCMIGKENLTVKAEVENRLGVKEGDIVDVELEFSSVLSASFIAYGIPFAAFLVGCMLGFYIFSQYIAMSKDILALITGLIFITSSYFFIKSLDKKGIFKQRFSIKIVE